MENHIALAELLSFYAQVQNWSLTNWPQFGKNFLGKPQHSTNFHFADMHHASSECNFYGSVFCQTQQDPQNVEVHVVDLESCMYQISPNPYHILGGFSSTAAVIHVAQ